MGILMLNGNNYTGGIQQVYGKSSGAIATFTDGGDNKPLKSLKVAINPIQASGTPTPSNPLPISGWTECKVQRTGKNLLNKNNVTFASGSYDEYGNPISNPSIKHTSNYEEVKPNTTYTFSGTIYDSSVAVRLFYFDKNQNWLGRTEPYRTNEITFTTPNNCKYYQIQCSVNISSADDWQLEHATSASAYEPYNGNTYPITWSEAGEVFGGYVDIVSGSLNITWVSQTYDGSDDEAWSKFGSGSASAYAMKITIDNLKVASSTDEVVKSNLLQTVSPSATWGSYSEFISSQASRNVLVAGISTITTVTDWRTWLSNNNLQVVYELATAIEIQLTPTQINTLLGNNNIWSDTGEIEECVYQRDLNIVINQFDERITALEQALNSSGTRSLSLSKSAVKEEETKEEITEEPKEEEQNEDKR